MKIFENIKRKEEEQDIKNIDKILDINQPSPIAQTKIYYRNSWKCNIKRRIISWILEISIYKLFFWIHTTAKQIPSIAFNAV